MTLILAVYIPFQHADNHSIEYMNARLNELKQASESKYLDEKSNEVTAILKTGNKVFLEDYKEISGQLTFVASFVFAISVLLLKFTSTEDLVWAGASYSVIFGLGSFGFEYYVAILLPLVIAYQIKKKKRTTN